MDSQDFYLQTLVFPRVLHTLSVTEKKFKVFVAERSTQNKLGCGAPYFSSFSPSECTGYEERKFLALSIPLLVNNEVVLTKPFAETDLDWYVAVGNTRCNTEEAKKFVLDMPTLNTVPVLRTHISSNTLAVVGAADNAISHSTTSAATTSITHFSVELENPVSQHERL